MTSYFKEAGYARCFRSIGLYEDSFTWKHGDRFYEFFENSLQSYYKKDSEIQNSFVKLAHLEDFYAKEINEHSKDYKPYD